jgi:hypothetical protein
MVQIIVIDIFQSVELINSKSDIIILNSEFPVDYTFRILNLRNYFIF